MMAQGMESKGNVCTYSSIVMQSRYGINRDMMAEFLFSVLLLATYNLTFLSVMIKLRKLLFHNLIKLTLFAIIFHRRRPELTH